MKEIKNSYDIGITTFSLRIGFAENLIRKIRGFGVENRIILCINGEKDGEFNQEYRRKILNLCLEFDNIFPIFFIEMRGLSKMWNTALIHSVCDNVLMFNDDIEIHSPDIFTSINDHINSPQYYGLTKINSTFSYYVANKKYIDALGYFDERLLGFGEEDGDIEYRSIAMRGTPMNNIWINGLHNIISNIRHEHVKPGVAKYSFFNRDFIFNKKYKCGNSVSKISGMFGIDCDPLLEDTKLYPYESFFQENKQNL